MAHHKVEVMDDVHILCKRYIIEHVIINENPNYILYDVFTFGPSRRFLAILLLQNVHNAVQTSTSPDILR